ncbi:MAG: aminotransferase class III-fold pyridoxal phosphate-dependent enzyme [Spirochaetaceae bacterium]|nr:aminotransferase class III-fold pyridoxal phosphate-dependent enzyme [Spirochaetaceae bacterium]
MSADKRYESSQALFDRATEVIPGGIYGSKSPGFTVPGRFPYYFTEGAGCRLKDADGHQYIDYLCGFGSMILGFGNPAVDDPAVAQLRKGDLLNQPGPAMVELAEKLVDLIDGMDWAVFSKNGTDATTLAVSLARVHTGKSHILMADGAYHGSANWCSSNSHPILRDKDEVRTFAYGDASELEALFDELEGRIAGVILTPYHHATWGAQIMPPEGWHQEVRRLCDKEGALFVMDDIRANFRMSLYGSHTIVDARPDFIAMGKSLANGYPIGALMGTEELKKTAAAFFITGTFWTSTVPYLAALACLGEMERMDIVSHMNAMGRRLGEGLIAAGADAGYRISMTGPPAIPFMTFADDPDLWHNQEFSARMAAKGVYMHPHHNWFLSYAHKEPDVDETLEKAAEAFMEVKTVFGE